MNAALDFSDEAVGTGELFEHSVAVAVVAVDRPRDLK